MVSENYIELRQQVLDYTNKNMNLTLNNDKQVYIAVFDIPVESIILNKESQTLALVFGLNTHLYCGDGAVLTDLEKNPDVMHAMQSLLISSHQVLGVMTKTETPAYYPSKNIRAYLKTREGIFFKELSGNTKEEQFLKALLNNVLAAIVKAMK